MRLGMVDHTPQVQSYRQPVEQVLAALHTDARLGLSEPEARSRLERYGRNDLTADAPVPAWRKFLAQFQDALVVLLLVAASISAALWFYERDSALPYEAIAIGAVVVLNAIMGYAQEARAESAVAALRQMAAAHARVLRDGEPSSVSRTTRRSAIGTTCCTAGPQQRTGEARAS